MADLSRLAPALMAVVQKNGPDRKRLHALSPQLTPRALDVCARLLLGMMQHGIACDLGIALPRIKALRHRASARMGNNCCDELFARVLPH